MIIILGKPSFDRLTNVLSNLKYHTPNLVEFYNPHKDLPDNIGLMGRIDAVSEYETECAYIEKFRYAKDLLERSGDEAIDKYIELTETPDKDHPLYEHLSVFDGLDSEFSSMMKTLTIPIEKDELKVYLNAYSSFSRKN